MEPAEWGELVAVLAGEWPAGGVSSLAATPPAPSIDRVSTDTREIAKGDIFFALAGERFDGHDFVECALASGASACVVSRRHAARLAALAAVEGGRRLVAVEDPLAALERLAHRNRRESKVEVTAITGSVGKTTTKEFLRVVLSRRFATRAAPKSFNNRIGVARTLLSADRSTEHLVVEMGTSGPGELAHLSRSVRPERVIITTVAPAHLSGLRDIDGVIAAKAEILEGLSPLGVAYVGAGVPGYEHFVERAPGGVRSFGLERGDVAAHGIRPTAVADVGWDFEVGSESYTVLVPGRHNVVNALAAVAVALDLGLDPHEIRAGLAECRLPPRRLDVRVEGDVLFVDDSYNANPRSMESALDAFDELAARRPDGRRIAVLGDMLELGDESRGFHERIGQRLAARPVDCLVTVGGDSRYLSASFVSDLASRGLGDTARVAHFESALQAEAHLASELRGGDTILFKASNLLGMGRLAESLRATRRGD